MATAKANPKKRKQLVTIISAVVLFITSLVFTGNPALQGSINALVNTVSNAISNAPAQTDSTYIAN